MTETATSRSISQLGNSTDVLRGDALLLSQYDTDSYTMYSTRQLPYDVVLSTLSADVDVSSVPEKIDELVDNADGIHNDVDSIGISVGLDEETLGSCRVSSEYTEQMGEDLGEISDYVADVLPKYKFNELDESTNDVYIVSLFSRNTYNGDKTLIELSIPQLLAGYSRKFTLETRSTSPLFIRFVSETPQKFLFSDNFGGFPISADTNCIFDFVEVSSNCFFVDFLTATDVPQSALSSAAT